MTDFLKGGPERLSLYLTVFLTDFIVTHILFKLISAGQTQTAEMTLYNGTGILHFHNLADWPNRSGMYTAFNGLRCMASLLSGFLG